MKQTTLHPILAKDCLLVGSLSVCTLLLMNDCHYPWLILVPDRPDLRDFDELSDADTMMVHSDIKQASQGLRSLFKPTKINVAALGNQVPQLHIHVIARFETDKAWPKPVWGLHPSLPYAEDGLDPLLEQIKSVTGIRNP